MTREQAESELMQIYGLLSEEKKKALDVAFKAMEQADNIPVMYYPQVDGITPTVVAQADGEYKTEKSCKTCKHYGVFSLECGRCDKDMTNYSPKQADREYILKKDVMGCIGQTSLHWELARKLRKLPTVSIPPEHDGCKDCVYQANPEDAMPCRECKQNYMDKWKAKANKVGHWEYNQYDGNPNIGNWHCSECRNIVSDMPTCMGKPLYEFCPHCGSPMEIER